ncbi:hypothetical protein BCV69DRAFT_278829 [Microstroma glucosiphilum]|uniref:Uncharacterized protein n=1 Tax=Pseudomicrostroma glucosiphilum TaxID=1684307 RepID=A0A316TZR0_9BASI|nr:hypothetical protein BCV69DRAFT_278829 [Pseudomicrostroma glucosiphilum]PWN18679.1 hypothetical protein BCV69DRAFT_278829 [Pseudomicrostroma glucosiphilum]
MGPRNGCHSTSKTLRPQLALSTQSTWGAGAVNTAFITRRGFADPVSLGPWAATLPNPVPSSPNTVRTPASGWASSPRRSPDSVRPSSSTHPIPIGPPRKGLKKLQEGKGKAFLGLKLELSQLFERADFVRFLQHHCKPLSSKAAPAKTSKWHQHCMRVARRSDIWRRFEELQQRQRRQLGLPTVVAMRGAYELFAFRDVEVFAVKECKRGQKHESCPLISSTITSIHSLDMHFLALLLILSALVANVAGMRSGPGALPPGHERIYGQRYNRHDEPVWDVQESSPSRPSSPNTDAIGITAWQIRQAQRTAPTARTARPRSPSPDGGSTPRNFATPLPTPSPPRSEQRRKKGFGLGKLLGCLTCGKPGTSGSPGNSGRRRYASPGASPRSSPSRHGSRRPSGGGSPGHVSVAASPESQYYHAGSSGAWRPWGE